MTAYTQENQNMQYSKKKQKKNIKSIEWKEKAQADLGTDLKAIMKQTAGVTIEPSDILEIHRIPEEQGRISPVIAKLRNSDSKIKINTVKIWRDKPLYHVLPHHPSEHRTSSTT